MKHRNFSITRERIKLRFLYQKRIHLRDWRTVHFD